MMRDLVTAGLCYLAIGATVWALMDPSAYRDFVVRAYLKKHRALPGPGYLMLAVVVAIVRWPVVAVEWLRVWRGVAR